MREWDFKIVSVSRYQDRREIEDAINAQLAEGWELLAVTPAEPDAHCDRAWFRRRR